MRFNKFAYVLKFATIEANLRTVSNYMHKQPIELMFSAYRRELLSTLLLRPDEKYHVRELGRMTGIPVGSLHRELKSLAESGLLLREHSGNQVFYQANRDSSIYSELAAIFRKTTGFATLLRAALQGLDAKIELAFVFGSMASGRQDSTSDVDVLVLGNLKLAEVVKALGPVHESLRREINPVVMTLDKFVAQADKQERFVMRTLDEPKIFLKGNEGELAEFVEDWSAR